MKLKSSKLNANKILPSRNPHRTTLMTRITHNQYLVRIQIDASKAFENSPFLKQVSMFPSKLIYTFHLLGGSLLHR